MADESRADAPRYDENRSDPSRGVNKQDARSKRSRGIDTRNGDPIRKLQEEVREHREWREKLVGDGIISIKGHRMKIDFHKLGDTILGSKLPLEVCVNGSPGYIKYY